MDTTLLLACEAVLGRSCEWSFSTLTGSAPDWGHLTCAASVMAAALLAVAFSFSGFVAMFEADAAAGESHPGCTWTAALF